MTKTMYYLENAIHSFNRMLLSDSINNPINNKMSMTSRQCVKTEYELLEDILDQYGIATIIRKYLNSDSISDILNQIDDEEINCSNMDCLKNTVDRLLDLEFYLKSGLSQKAIVENRLI